MRMAGPAASEVQKSWPLMVGSWQKTSADGRALPTANCQLPTRMDDADSVVHDLLDRGAARLPSGIVVRLVAFGAFPPGSPVPPCRIVSLGHVLEFLQTYVRKHWHVLRHLQFKDPAFGFLMTMEKARRGGAGRRGEEGVEVVSGEPRSFRGRGRPDSAPRLSRHRAPGRRRE